MYPMTENAFANRFCPAVLFILVGPSDGLGEAVDDGDKDGIAAYRALKSAFH